LYKYYLLIITVSDIQVIEEHKDMQSAMSSLGGFTDVKHNDQELEDELANLLSEDEPSVLKKEKHLIPGIVFVVYNNIEYIILIINKQYIFQTFQAYQIIVLKMKN